MEAVECGAAALGSILAYHGRHVPLEELRLACGVSRDGAKASNIVRAARAHGLVAKGFRKETVAELADLPLPAIVFWNFNHFLVVEGFRSDRVFLNDPATGPRTVPPAEFDESFTGVVLTFERGPDFQPGGARPAALAALRARLRGSEPAVLFVVLVSLALLVPGLLVPAFARGFVDQVLAAGRTDWLAPLLAGLALTAVLRGALTWLQQHALLRLETKLALTASAAFFRHVLRLPVAFFTQRYAGEIGGRVMINDSLAQLLSRELATALLGLLLVTFYALAMLRYSVPLTALGVAIAAINLLVLRQVSRRQADGHQRLLQEQGKLLGATMAGLQTIETLKATGGEAGFFTRWSGTHAKSLNAEQRFGATAHLLNVAPTLLTAVSHATILGTGGWLVIEGRLSVGALVAFQTLMASLLEPVNQLVRLGGTLQTVDGSIKRLDDVLRHPRDPHTRDANATAAPAASPGPRTIKLSGQLELNNVSFGYSRLEPPLIENFSLTLQPGQRIALVGPTGCGKSTVSRLVSGLYEPWSGEVRFDGHLRRDIPAAAFAHSVALVDQDVFLFAGTIRENLTLWDATAPESALIAAAKDACIHDTITARPGGYDSLVEESGRNFSGGQRQRLELARALVNQPTLLLLDEATSALDAQTEHAIDAHLRRRGCACLIIAHRLSTIRDCDEIIVMDRGKIVQRGTHAQLAAQPGLYLELIKEQ
jgi:NHLM bacteriocin system ABC transporter, peptidase/ATP-binding protein